MTRGDGLLITYSDTGLGEQGMIDTNFTATMTMKEGPKASVDVLLDVFGKRERVQEKNLKRFQFTQESIKNQWSPNTAPAITAAHQPPPKPPSIFKSRICPF